MNLKNEVTDYLKVRMERIKRNNPYLENKHKEIKKKIDRAVQEPSLKCTDGNEHNFVILAHADTSEKAIYYFCCDKCDEVVVAEQERAVNDPMREVLD